MTRAVLSLVGLAVVLSVTVVVGLLVGSGGIASGEGSELSPASIVAALSAGPAAAETGAGVVLWTIRLPQVLLAAVVGAALAVSGSIFQATLRNPLADPLLLGVAAGASLAASIAIGLGADSAWVPAASATLGAGATLLFVFAVAGRQRRFDAGTMVLAGVIASTFYSALTLLLLSVTPTPSISRILQWTMGGFGDVGFAKVRWAGPAIGALVAMAAAGTRPLNLLAMGDDVARSAGLAVGGARAALYALGAALTGVAVAAAGVVGFVGLVVPHVARRLVGPDERVALPASALLGGTLCVVADAVARTAVPLAQAAWAWWRGVPAAVSPVELPVGVVTALIGAPFFLALLMRRHARGGA